MKRTAAALLAGSCLLASCNTSDYLDVNTNPNAPQSVSANLYLAPMLHWMVTSPQYDGILIGMYAQEWTFTVGETTLSNFDRMGGVTGGSDFGGEQWRDVYWSLGQNLIDMMDKSRAQQRWDLLGVGYVLKAWGWQALTDVHGALPIKEAFDQTRTTFDYDSQEFAYQEVQRLLDSAIVNLQRSDGAVDRAYLASGDHIYDGDRSKWLKLAYGMLATNLNHYSNKSTYNPDSVIALVNRSFASNKDDALLTYPGVNGTTDLNFLGRTRNNVTSYRQTQFVVNLMDGTAFGGVVDPRMSRMLSAAPDSQYRGLDINEVGFGGLKTAQQPNNFFDYPGSGGVGLPGKYLFADKAKVPAMTYAQLQFVKAEAAYRKGDKATALQAYRNGVSAHIDFVNERNLDDNQSPTQISAAEKAAFLASPAIVPAAGSLTLTKIMSQKYIAEWAWAHDELWMDMRRYHYTDVDPATGNQVYPGFAPPTNLYPDNGGKLVYRIRPRYNSEYVWNRPGLDAVGGLAIDYNTKPLWIIQP